MDESPLLRTDGALSEAREIHARFSETVQAVDRTRFGSVSTPSEVWRLGAATEWSARIGLVGLLRRNGIPARVPDREEWVEAWIDGEWIPADPLDVASWNRREGEISDAYADPVQLSVSFLDLGAPMTRVEGWKHFRLARLEEGRIEPLYADYPVRDGRLDMEIAPGEWWLFGGQRNHAGCPRVEVRQFTAGSGESIDLEMDLGIPAAEREAEDLAPRQLSDEALVLFGLEPWPAGLNADVAILNFWTQESEACVRTADAMNAALNALEPPIPALKSIEVTVEAERPDSFRLDDISAFLRIGDMSQLPVVAMVERETRRTLLFTQGMQLALGDLMRQAMTLREGAP